MRTKGVLYCGVSSSPQFSRLVFHRAPNISRTVAPGSGGARREDPTGFPDGRSRSHRPADAAPALAVARLIVPSRAGVKPHTGLVATRPKGSGLTGPAPLPSWSPSGPDRSTASARPKGSGVPGQPTQADLWLRRTRRWSEPNTCLPRP
jgi:hypothetical protein